MRAKRARHTGPDESRSIGRTDSYIAKRGGVIVTSNKPFGPWGEVFGDDAVATAMIDRLVHPPDRVDRLTDGPRSSCLLLG